MRVKLLDHWDELSGVGGTYDGVDNFLVLMAKGTFSIYECCTMARLSVYELADFVRNICYDEESLLLIGSVQNVKRLG